ncbi:MAG: LamB/YcsF family protein [Anaerolineaceae bacterium]|nr:LamB/YcsF family protein [Anaerolineaceae bacterium]
MKIDLNCDMGESFGEYVLGNDAAIMPYITSVNIACGFHAGDPNVMARTVQLAKQMDVAVGAHPGYPDLNGFGRRNMSLSVEEIENMILYQVGALAAFTRANGVELRHVKPHGALYNQAAVDGFIAQAVARGVKRFSHSLILVGLAGSLLLAKGQEEGLQTASEGFPDRAYLPDGRLMPRNQPNALVDSPEEIALNALRLAQDGIRIDKSGVVDYVPVETLCLHGDNPVAVENARLISRILPEAGIKLIPLTMENK